MRKFKALLVGCGNIGAGYDFSEKEKVWTYAKAFAERDMDFSVYDTDMERARFVAGHYRVNQLSGLDEQVLEQFDVICIATPTVTHFSYLELFLERNIPLIICEKPLVAATEEAEKLAEIYERSDSRLMVNYIRRFQPAYREMQVKIRSIMKQEGLRSIIIKYRRGFLNNGGHAADLLQFLFNAPVDFSSFQTLDIKFDCFDNDPTLSGSFSFLGASCLFIGISDIAYPVFEIELFFERSRIRILNSGDEVQYFSCHGERFRENENERRSGILNSYMLPVVDKAVSLLLDRNREDNFATSIEMNRNMLKIIEPIKNLNATISN